MLDEKTIQEFCALRASMYDFYYAEDSELVAIDADYVQVTEQGFVQILERYPKYLVRRISYKHYELSVDVDGTKFLTVGTRGELETVGILVSEDMKYDS